MSAFQLFELKILLLNQTFYPDVMATGQYLNEVAVALVERGHEVTVVTSRRAYDHPELQFPKQEHWRGVKILRVGATGFGKGAKWKRAADFASFLFWCCLRLARLPRQDVVVALTSPPLISFIGACASRFWRARFCYWVMDFNPDEAIAAGWLRANSLSGRIFEKMSRFSLWRADRVIALDWFMRDRIAAKGIGPDKIAVIPPWSHDGEVRFDPAGREAFRKAHSLDGKFVVMHSGNHSPCHPLDTLLEAAERLRGDERIVFLFVGGGSEFRKIQALAEMQNAECRMQKEEAKSESGFQPSVSSVSDFQSPGDSNPGLRPPISDLRSPISHLPTSRPLSNLLCLPYQPLDQLAGSLSAADLQVVVMGDPFVGLIHPCKIYNVLAVGAPVLYLGPEPSHLSEILALVKSRAAIRVGHGDVDECVAQIRRFAAENQRGESGSYQTVTAQFSQRVLLPKLVAELERVPKP
jgi:glycosyltransferase involved in cell wall biosynthesis